MSEGLSPHEDEDHARHEEREEEIRHQEQVEDMEREDKDADGDEEDETDAAYEASQRRLGQLGEPEDSEPNPYYDVDREDDEEDEEDEEDDDDPLAGDVDRHVPAEETRTDEEIERDRKYAVEPYDDDGEVGPGVDAEKHG